MVGDKERLEDELAQKDSDLFDAYYRISQLEDSLAEAEMRISELEIELASYRNCGIRFR